MEKNKEQKGKIIDRINQALDISPEVFGGMSVELLAGKQATVEGIKAILEYDDTMVVLKDNKNLVRIMGSSLIMPHMTDHSIVIKGNIQSVEYMNGGVGDDK